VLSDVRANVAVVRASLSEVLCMMHGYVGRYLLDIYVCRICICMLLWWVLTW
jgi:hypothetical protein